MNKIKLSTLGAAFLATTGIATAGKVYVDNVHEYDFAGNITITSTGDVFITGGTAIHDTGRDDDGTPPPDDTTDTAPPPTPTPPPGNAACGDVSPVFAVEQLPLDGFPDTGTYTRVAFDGNKITAIPFTLEPGYILKLAMATSTIAETRSAHYAISECPGDFSLHLPSPGDLCTMYSGVFSNWFVAAADTAVSICEIQPNTTYYLNIVYASNPASQATDTCPLSVCGGDLGHYDVSYLL